MKINILLSAVGRRDYLIDYFKNLTDYDVRIIAVNSIKDTTAMWKADVSYVSPEIRSKDYIPFLLQVCEKESVDIIISLFDLDTLFLSYNKSKFDEIGAKLIMPDFNIVEICLDKLKMSNFLTDNEFDTPRPFSSLEDVEKALEIKTTAFPLVIKPRWGQGSIATEIVYNREELFHAYKLLTSKIKNTSIAHIETLNFENTLLIQEFIKGQEYGVDCINDLKGLNKAVVVKKKLAMRSGETDAAITVMDKSISEVISKLGNLLKHVSIIDIDVIKRDNKVYIIDINPRFGGGYPFSQAAGVNLPKSILDWHFGEEINKECFDYKPNILSLKGIALATKLKDED